MFRPRVVVDNRASNTHTVLEVNGRDRPGLLHDVTAAISEQGLQIASAHVTTYGVRAVDVFYVKDVFGLKVENEAQAGRARQALLAALQPPEDAPVPKQPGAASGSRPSSMPEPAPPPERDEDTAEAQALAAAVAASDADPRTVSHEVIRAWLKRLADGEFDIPPPEPR